MDDKQTRLNKILEKGKAIIIPMDHGVSDGPIAGLTEMNDIVKKVEAGGASAVILHKGIIKSLKEPPKCGLIMHLSASTKFAPDPNNKVQVAEVEEATVLGADAVSVHINIGSDAEPEMLKILGKVARDCEKMQIPLLAMMYARGKNIQNQLDADAIAHVARVGAELGADIVKCNYSGDAESFKKVVRGCPVPVIIAGGPKCETDREVLEMVRGAMDAGAIGVSLGRNVFRHRNPTAIVKAIRKIIVEDCSVEEALKLLGE